MVTGKGSQHVLELMADKWTPVLITTLSGRTLRFGELRRETGPISQKVLAATLRTMERNGLVTRTSHGEVPPRVEYALTNMGNALVESLGALETWASAHLDDVEAARERWDSGSQTDPVREPVSEQAPNPRSVWNPGRALRAAPRERP